MAHQPFSYELSVEGDNDLSDIFDYSVEQFGIEQTIKYIAGFERVFEDLCNNPESDIARFLPPED